MIYEEKQSLILIKLKEILNEKRFMHSLGVAKEAKNLAKLYGADEDKAYFAGICHDYAKNLKKEEVKNLIDKYKIELDSYEKKSLNLAHGEIASYIMEYEYDIKDKDILNSIKYHTTGRKNMSKLEKIICLADYIEENREFDGVEKLRFLSKIDLDLALYASLNSTLAFLIKNNSIIHPRTIECRNNLLQNIKEKDKGKRI